MFGRGRPAVGALPPLIPHRAAAAHRTWRRQTCVICCSSERGFRKSAQSSFSSDALTYYIVTMSGQIVGLSQQYHVVVYMKLS